MEFRTCVRRYKLISEMMKMIYDMSVYDPSPRALNWFSRHIDRANAEYEL